MKITNTHHKPLRIDGVWLQVGETADLQLNSGMAKRLVKLGQIKRPRTRKKKVETVEVEQPELETESD